MRLRYRALRISFTLLVCITVTTCSRVMAQQENQKVIFAIAIHGGAGKAPSTEEWKKNRKAVLKEALDTGTEMLKSARSSLDTVEAVVRILEDSPYFNAGKGAVFNAAETHELDASIMGGGNRACGAVGGVRTVRNPISLARRVMTDTNHILLASDGAEKFADDYADDPMIIRVPNSYFSTEYRRAKLHRSQRMAKQSDGDGIGTVGCVALDTHGNLAAATSTGGLNNKKYGRIGDSPIVCAGTFADNATCAVSGTGIGEDFMRNAVAYDVSARMEYRGDSLGKAVEEILFHPHRKVRGGIIAVSHDGKIVMRFNTEGMARAAADSTGYREIRVAK